MKSNLTRWSGTLTSLLIGVVALTSPSATAAEAPRGIAELARLTVVSTRLMRQAKADALAQNYGFRGGGHCLFGAAIKPEDSRDVEVHLARGTEIMLLAAGDDNAQDIDLFVTDPTGKQIAKDDKDDATANVAFRTTQSGPHTFRLKLYRGQATSFCTLVVLEKNGGFDIPFANLMVAMGNYVQVAGASSLFVHEMTGGLADARVDNELAGWCLFGAVMKQDDNRGVTGLKLSSDAHVFLAVGCGRAADIDLKVINQRGDVLVSDFAPDAHPMGLGIARAADTYQFESTLPQSNGAALVLSGVLKVDVNAAQAIRPVVGR